MRPRTRCQTCAIRHVKCKGPYPICTECATRGYECQWSPAVTQRKGVTVSTCSRLSAGRKTQPGRSKVQHLLKGSRHALPGDQTPDRIDRQLRQDLLALASIKYFLFRYRVDLDSNNDIDGWICKYDKELASSAYLRILESSETLLALGFFGVTERSRDALQQSFKMYHGMLPLISKILLRGLTYVPDELLVVLLTLSRYEDIIGGFHRPSYTFNGFAHCMGAAALLPARQKQSNRSPRSLALDIIVLRHATAGAIYMNTDIPSFLDHIGKSLRTPLQQQLDGCMIELSRVGARMQAASIHEPGAEQQALFADVRQAALTLEARFQNLSYQFCHDSRYSVLPSTKVVAPYPIFVSEGDIRTFKDVEAGRDYTWYCACRLRNLDILFRTISTQKADLEQALLERFKRGTSLLDNIEACALGILASVPYFFNSLDSISKTTDEACRRAAATSVGKAVFPILAISTSFAVPARHKRRAKELLLLIVRITGSRILFRLFDGPGRPFSSDDSCHWQFSRVACPDQHLWP